MPNFNEIENVLKTTYGRVMEQQLNTKSSPILANIKTVPVAGKEFSVSGTYGINGGAGFTGSPDLPDAGGQQYINFKSTVKRLYAPIEFDDLAWKASKTDIGAFLNIAKMEFESAQQALKFNLGRSVYGDGSGILTTFPAGSTSNTVTVANTQYLIEGMICDIYNSSSTTTPATASARITSINRSTKTVTFDKNISGVGSNDSGFITLQDSYNNELTGFGKILSPTGTLYGVNKSNNAWMVPYSEKVEGSGETINDEIIFDVLSTLQMHRGAETDLIVCGQSAYKAYSSYLKEYNIRVENNVELKGGFKAMSVAFDGRDIPLIMDRFAPSNEALFLETKHLGLYGIGGWDWLEYENGSIIQRLTNKAVYQAVMGRYCDLLCTHPGGIGRITNCDGTDS